MPLFLTETKEWVARQRMFLLAVSLVSQWPFKVLLGEEQLPTEQDHTLTSWLLSSALLWEPSQHVHVVMSEALPSSPFFFIPHVSFQHFNIYS